MNLIFIITISIFISYILFIVIRFGILPSISDSYYELPNSAKPLFTFFMWSVAIGSIILGDTLLMFLAGSGIAFVGAAAAFKKKITKPVHYIGAISATIFSQLSITLDFGRWDVTILFCISLLLLLKVKNRLFWIEMIAFVHVFYILYENLN